MPGFENTAGINVSNFYGARDSGGTVGVEKSSGSISETSISFTGTSLNQSFLPPVVVPKGMHLLRAVLRVDEAFTLGGTSPTVIFGGTVPATNGIVLSQAELQSVGTKVPASTGTGTWAVSSATGTTASEKLTKTLGGTTPTVTAGVGKATLLLEFAYKTKV